MSAPVDVLAVWDRLVRAAHVIDVQPPADDEVAEARAALAELIEAIRPRVAMTFDEARAADARGEYPIYCRFDALNACWTPERGAPATLPLQHWGGGDACPDCRIRAALARLGGAA